MKQQLERHLVIPHFDRVLPQDRDMNTLTVKGQVTIPKAVRDLLEVGPGNAVEFSMDPDGRVVVHKAGDARRPTSRFDHLRGSAGVGLSTDQIMALTRGDAE
jgi:antitoxin PrlF